MILIFGVHDNVGFNICIIINYIYRPLCVTEELPSAKVDPRIVADYNPIRVESVCFALAGLIMQIESGETYYC